MLLVLLLPLLVLVVLFVDEVVGGVLVPLDEAISIRRKQLIYKYRADIIMSVVKSFLTAVFKFLKLTSNVLKKILFTSLCILKDDFLKESKFEVKHA